MKPTDVDFLSTILGFVSEGWSFGVAAMLVLVGLTIPFAIRIVRGSSVREIFGWTNGYVKDKVFVSAIEDVKDLIKEKADAEGARMDKHGKEIGELRTAIQDVDRKVAKMEGIMEQYRGK